MLVRLRKRSVLLKEQIKPPSDPEDVLKDGAILQRFWVAAIAILQS